MEIIAYLGLGLVAGTLAGLLGIGGGIILIPAYFFIFKWQGISENIIMHLAIGTSLATMVITSLASSHAHHKQRAVLWPILKVLIPGIIVGALMGAVATSFIESENLKVLFGCFMVATALHMNVQHSKNLRKPILTLNPKSIPIWSGASIGFISAVFGVGGGVITVPFLTSRNIPLAKAIGTSSVAAIPIGLAGAIGYFLTGLQQPDLPANTLGYILLPATAWTALSSLIAAQFGAHLTHQRIKAATLQRYFSFGLALVGIGLIL